MNAPVPMNEVSDKININLLIGRQQYPLYIARNEEERFRRAALEINEKIGRYKATYPHQDEEKYMAIALLDFAVKALQVEAAHATEPYEEVIGRLTAEIESALGHNTIPAPEN